MAESDMSKFSWQKTRPSLTLHSAGA